MSETLNGSCLCGACKFTATEHGEDNGMCHCQMCRKWSGGVYIAVDCGDSVKFEDGAPTGHYKGSEWGERIFCKECGSSMVWQVQDGTFQHVSVHCFDEPSQFELRTELFIDRKPGNYALESRGQKQITEAEFMAMFAAQGGG